MVKVGWEDEDQIQCKLLRRECWSDENYSGQLKLIVDIDYQSTEKAKGPAFL